MPYYQLAQVNIAQLQVPEGNPQVQEFFDNLDRINRLAETADGFVWRFEGDYPADPMLVFNISVWESIEQLTEFVYRTAHVEFFRQRRNWFTPLETSHLALWWIRAGQQPGHQEALLRLRLLDQHGPGQQAFTFAERFAAPAPA